MITNTGNTDQKLAECPHCGNRERFAWDKLFVHIETSHYDFEAMCSSCKQTYTMDIKLKSVTVSTKKRGR